jgi:hypothetical protein
MRVTLTDDQHLMLELIAYKPIPATPTLARYTTVLAAARLIELSAEAHWRVTRLGEVVLLEPHTHWLH